MVIRLSVEEPLARIMVETVFTVTGEAMVADAAALMAEKRVSCLPISMGQGAVGVVTEKDIIQKVVTGGKDLPVSERSLLVSRRNDP